LCSHLHLIVNLCCCAFCFYTYTLLSITGFMRFRTCMDIVWQCHATFLGFDVISWMNKIPASKVSATYSVRSSAPASVSCNDQYECPDEYTCCHMLDGGWGCCPYMQVPSAVFLTHELKSNTNFDKIVYIHPHSMLLESNNYNSFITNFF